MSAKRLLTDATFCCHFTNRQPAKNAIYVKPNRIGHYKNFKEIQK